MPWTWKEGDTPQLSLPNSVGLILLLVLPGCSLHRQPDFELLYHEMANEREGRTPVVGIHGLMGSELVDPRTGDVVWGHLKGLLSKTADMRLALPLDSEQETSLEVIGSIKQIGGVEVYGGIVRTLIDSGGYIPVDGPGEPPAAPFFPFAYDWRLSCVKNWTFRDNLLNFLLRKELPLAPH